METNIRNKDQSYKPWAREVSEEAQDFIRKILKEWPDYHPDDIRSVVQSAIHNECSMKTMFLIE